MLIAPALHSASLRNYVMIIVSTSVLIGGAALVMDPNPGSVVSRTRVRPARPPHRRRHHRRGNCGGSRAIDDVGGPRTRRRGLWRRHDLPQLRRARSRDDAVLGGDAHRTHLRPRVQALPRTGSAVATAGSGPRRADCRRPRNLHGGLLLSVATTDTAPHLKEYFAEFGPTLGHGRNIVNVILVDFRAFDTLGEITVLATAAIGVRGLLRLGATGSADHEPVGPVTSPIFRTAARLLMPLLLLFSVFLLVRGHNEPGGGFVGGLIAAAAFALYGIAFGVQRARQALLVRPMTLLGAGLLIAMVSGVPAVLRGQPFLTALWVSTPVALGTPVLFDIGVFLVVAGVVLMMIFTLAEES